jgi:hypothetical protein
MTKAEILDESGKLIIGSVRDETIEYISRVLSGQMKDSLSKEIREKLTSDSNERIQDIFEGCIGIIDHVLHQFLWISEQESRVQIVFRDEKLSLVPLNSVSDGLSGEMYGLNGWIEKFSKFSIPDEPQ